MSRPREPTTVGEWQNAVDVAAACRVLADLRMYGLIEGGPEINVQRCDEILARGRKRGIEPSRPLDQLTVALVREINREAGGNDGGQAAV